MQFLKTCSSKAQASKTMYNRRHLIVICAVVCFVVFVIFMYLSVNTPNDVSLPKFEELVNSERTTARTLYYPLENCLEGTVTVQPGGRLANAIFEYASVWSVAKIYGMRPFIPQEVLDRLSAIYKPLNAPPIKVLLDEAKRICNTSLTEEDILKRAITPRRKDSLKWVANARNNREPLVLWRWIVLTETVVLVVDLLREEFQFRDEFLQSSRKTFETVTQRISPEGQVSITFIGVHVRRTDYNMYVVDRYSVKPADENYFRRAAEVMLRRLRTDGVTSHVAFLVVSDDPQWCKSKLMPVLSDIQIPEAMDFSVHYVGQGGQSSPGHDMALLCQCNHSIRAYGTFALWSAMMAGGRTIVYNTKTDGPLGFLPYFNNWEAV